MIITIRKVFFLAFALTIAFMSKSCVADIVVSLASDGDTNVNVGNSGVYIISFYISESGTDDQSLLAAVPMFSVSGGLVQSPAGEISAVGSSGTPGFFGAGNLSVSELLNDPLDVPSTNFLVNQEFTAPQSVPDEPARSLWFTLNLDTTGLSDGVYEIRFQDDANSFFDDTGAAIAVNNNLTFTVSAIPEPTGLAGVAIAGIFVIRRRRIHTRCRG